MIPAESGTPVDPGDTPLAAGSGSDQDLMHSEEHEDPRSPLLQSEVPIITYKSHAEAKTAMKQIDIVDTKTEETPNIDDKKRQPSFVGLGDFGHMYSDIVGLKNLHDKFIVMDESDDPRERTQILEAMVVTQSTIIGELHRCLTEEKKAKNEVIIPEERKYINDASITVFAVGRIAKGDGIGWMLWLQIVVCWALQLLSIVAIASINSGIDDSTVPVWIRLTALMIFSVRCYREMFSQNIDSIQVMLAETIAIGDGNESKPNQIRGCTAIVLWFIICIDAIIWIGVVLCGGHLITRADTVTNTILRAVGAVFVLTIDDWMCQFVYRMAKLSGYDVDSKIYICDYSIWRKMQCKSVRFQNTIGRIAVSCQQLSILFPILPIVTVVAMYYFGTYVDYSLSFG